MVGTRGERCGQRIYLTLYMWQVYLAYVRQRTGCYCLIESEDVSIALDGIRMQKRHIDSYLKKEGGL